MKRTSLGVIVALAILAGCQKTNQTVAIPPSNPAGQPGTTGSLGDGQTPRQSPGMTPPTPGGSIDPASGAPGQVTPGASTSTTLPTEPPSSTPGATGPFTLQLVINKGEEMKYQSDSEAMQELPNAGDNKMPKMTPMKSSSQTIVKVVDVTGGKAKVELAVSNLKLTGGMDNPEAKKMMEKAARDSEGVKVSVSFDSQGQPSNMQYVKGSKAQAMSAGIDTDTGFFGISYPKKPVQIGDTWTHTFDFKSAAGPLGSMGNAKWKDSDITTVFTLKSVDTNAGTAVIGISAKGAPSMSMSAPSKPDPKSSAPAPQGMTINFDVVGGGFATVDLKSGTPREINYEMNVKFKSPMGTIGQKTKATLKRVS